MWTYNQTPDTNELYHYGVLDMKWGRRRAAKASAKASKYRQYAKNNRYDAAYERKDAKKVAKTDPKYSKKLKESAKYSESIAKDWDKKANQYDKKAEAITAKNEYKTAKKNYNKSFNKAYNLNAGSFSPSKKQRDKSTARWEKAYDDAQTVNTAKANYKKAKKYYKQSKS